MKLHRLSSSFTELLFFVAAAWLCSFAQSPPRYRFVDLGTLGGRNTTTNGGSVITNKHRIVVGGSDTTEPCPYLPGAVKSRAFKWENGVMTALPSLPGGCSGFGIAINSNGMVVGAADNGIIDPDTGQPEIRAVVWKDGQIIDLGTFGGNNSLANSVNDRGEVVGSAQNSIPDFSQFGGLIGLLLSQQQWRGFLWQDGNMQEIGTLGGADSGGIGDVAVNQRGQVGGISFTNDVVNSITQVPTLDTFLWTKGNLEDLGGFGGVFTTAFTMNNRGDVTGFSDIPGDLEAHAFLWRKGHMRDLGTLGGSFGGGGWLNERGHVTGASTTTNDEFLRGFIWRNGRMTSLGTLPGDNCSDAFVINAKDQIIGPSFTCGDQGPPHAYLWNESKMIDLNDYVPPGTHLNIFIPHYLTDEGEIAVDGLTPDGNERVALLIPCDNEPANAPGCRGPRAHEDVRQNISAASKEKREKEPLTQDRVHALRKRVRGGGTRIPWLRGLQSSTEPN